MLMGVTAERVVTYRHVCPLASGGMGSVSLALRHDGTVVRLYAIKRLHSHLRTAAEVRSSFVDEARIAGLLRHPNIVSVVDVGEDGDGPFLVMDYVDGVALSELSARVAAAGETMPLDVALKIAVQAARGLAAAHDLKSASGESLDVVHRDVSPQNVLVAFDGTVRVTDFGIAKAIGRHTNTRTGLLKGKLGYMAPEQLRFRPADQRSDLFAFGVVLYELLTSREVYPADDIETAARSIMDEPPPDIAHERAGVPPALRELLLRLLSKDPTSRPPNTRAVIRTLDAVLAEITTGAESNDVGAFVLRFFPDEHRERQRSIANAIANLESGPRVIGPELRWAIDPTAVLTPLPARPIEHTPSIAPTQVVSPISTLVLPSVMEPPADTVFAPPPHVTGWRGPWVPIAAAVIAVVLAGAAGWAFTAWTMQGRAHERAPAEPPASTAVE
jgi:eukaryotic-like serine/threonine-protein kinase